MENLTTTDLRTQTWGTPCGIGTPMREKCLSQELIIEYIDEYFGGQFYDVETYKEGNSMMFCGGSGKFSKETYDVGFLHKYVYALSNHNNQSSNDYLKELCEVGFDIPVIDIFTNVLSLEDRRDFICIIFSELVCMYDGSLRFECYGEPEIDIESE